MSRYHEWSMKVARASGNFSTHELRDGTSYLTGEVTTPLGFVSVYSQDDHSSYRVVIGGRLYARSENAGRSSRGLTIVAARFAREIAANNATPHAKPQSKRSKSR